MQRNTDLLFFSPFQCVCLMYWTGKTLWQTLRRETERHISGTGAAQTVRWRGMEGKEEQQEQRRQIHRDRLAKWGEVEKRCTSSSRREEMEEAVASLRKWWCESFLFAREGRHTWVTNTGGTLHHSWFKHWWNGWLTYSPFFQSATASSNQDVLRSRFPLAWHPERKKREIERCICLTYTTTAAPVVVCDKRRNHVFGVRREDATDLAIRFLLGWEIERRRIVSPCADITPLTDDCRSFFLLLLVYERDIFKSTVLWTEGDGVEDHKKFFLAGHSIRRSEREHD